MTTKLIPATIALALALPAAAFATPHAGEARCAALAHSAERTLAVRQLACERQRTRPGRDVDACRLRANEKFATARARLLLACPALPPEELASATGGAIWNTQANIQTLDGRCLDIWGDSTRNRTPIKLHQCHGGGNQAWAIRPNAIMGNGKCMDMPYATDGSGLWIFDCWGGWNQQLTMHDAKFVLTRDYPWLGARGLYVPRGEGAQVQVRRDLDSSFSVTPTGQLRLSDGRCLVPWWGGTADGTPIVAATCGSHPAQLWSFGLGEEGIKGRGSWAGKCIRAVGGVLQLWSCRRGDVDQRFTALTSIRGWDNKCLTWTREAQNGTPVTVRSCGASGYKTWRMRF